MCKKLYEGILLYLGAKIWYLDLVLQDVLSYSRCTVVGLSSTLRGCTVKTLLSFLSLSSEEEYKNRETM